MKFLGIIQRHEHDFFYYEIAMTVLYRVQMSTVSILSNVGSIKHPVVSTRFVTDFIWKYRI